MTLQKRYRNQIETVRTILDLSREIVKQNNPLDVFLTHHFRSNRKYGSRDRKLISGAVFGYFRWYGWLRRLQGERDDLSLLLGYLLDGNPVNEMIHFWAGQCGLGEEMAVSLSDAYNQGIEKQRKLVSTLIPDVELSMLNPPECGHWKPDCIAAFQRRPPLWIRLTDRNPERFISFLQEKSIDFVFHPANKNTLEIRSPLNIFESKDFREGNLQVQDIASQAVGLICNPAGDSVWWDVCAGAGGKSLHLSDLTGERATIYATDIDFAKLAELKKRAAKNDSYQKIVPMYWNGHTLPEFPRQINGVLVDAPCTCSGTWRRAPDMRWQVEAETIESFSKIQLHILSLAGKGLATGGTLIYATCSVFEQENQGVVERFLKNHPEFKPVETACPFTQNHAADCLSLMPPSMDGNGMFVARMIKS